MGVFSDFISSGALQGLVALWQGKLTDEQWNKYQQAVEQQIAEGKSGLEARARAAMDLIAENPDSQEAQNILRELNIEVPREMRGEVARSTRQYQDRRREFLNAFDVATGNYLTQERSDTDRFINELSARNAAIAEGYAGRETDVLGLLEGQGEQAYKDIRESYGKQTAAALQDLASRGLSGSGVGASVRTGLAKEESSSLAREREAVSRMRAEYLARLRGEGLAFDERAATLGAGFQESGIARRLAAQRDVEFARSQYDAAMSGDTLANRQAALNRYWNSRIGLGSDYANYLTGERDLALNTYLGTTGDYFDFINNVRNVPPNRAPLNAAYQSWGYAAAG